MANKSYQDLETWQRAMDLVEIKLGNCFLLISVR
jgi:hypothetical protein